VVDEQCREDVVDGRWVHCTAMARGSTPVLVVACWSLEVEGNCVTLESRVLAYGGYCLVVVDRRDWIFRASNPRHRLLPCSTFDSKRNNQARTSFVSIPGKTWYRGCTMTYAQKNKIAQETGMLMAVRSRADSPSSMNFPVIERQTARERGRLSVQ
jgi:hypothetical protein